jgi:hypothetical protein
MHYFPRIFNKTQLKSLPIGSRILIIGKIVGTNQIHIWTKEDMGNNEIFYSFPISDADGEGSIPETDLKFDHSKMLTPITDTFPLEAYSGAKLEVYEITKESDR